MTESMIRVEPVAGALGAQIHGVDLSEPLSDDTLDEIRDALHTCLVVFFRDQDLTIDQHYAFAKRIGALMPHPYVQGLPDYPEIIEIVKEPEETRNWGGHWHADLTFMDKPPGGAVLYGRELPPVGGDTMFANMCLAYETLSSGMRDMVDALDAVHVSGVPQRFSSAFRSMYEREGQDADANVHPVVRTHPASGRKALFVNRGFTSHFEDMTVEESAPLLHYLFEHATRPELTFRFRWSPGSVLIWDNRMVMHNALQDDFAAARTGHGFRRVLHRATLAGERPM